jgi:AAA domain
VRLPRDVADLQRLIREVAARLVVVDPIVAALDTALDSHKDQHVRTVLAQLAAITEEETCSIAMVGHLNKAPSRDAYVRVANSVAFWNAARSVVLVTEDPDEPEDQRLVAQRKANWAKLRPVERHRLEEIVLVGTLDPDSGAPIVTSRMVFLEVADDVDGADVLAPHTGGDDTKTARAEDFLAASIADGEWHDSAGLKTIAGAAGITERTLQRAAKDLDVETDRRGFPATTWWRLPKSRQSYTPQAGAASGTAQPSGSGAHDALVAPAPSGGGTTGGTVCVVGDDGYLELLDRALANRMITEKERRQRRLIHLTIRGARPVAEEGAA